MDTEQENKGLIEEMINKAEQAKEPGEIATQQVIHKGDKEVPSPMVATRMESAGYVYIYDTRTGERSVTNRNMLPTQLKKKREDGSSVFTTVKPGITPRRGNLKCMLHPDEPNRKHYDDLGLPVCRKANLTSPYQVRRHMEKRHPMEWQTIEQERIDAEKKEDKEFQRQLIGKVVGEAPLYVSDKDKKAAKK